MTTTSQQPLDLDAIRQRCEAASPDPWELVTTSTLHMNGTGGYNIRAASRPGFRLTITAFPADAQFIAHARTDIPVLLAEVDRLCGAHEPRRGSDVEAWIKAERDKYAEGDPVWTGLDYLLDGYRERSDTGAPLDRDVQGPTGGHTTDPAA